ncbi:hypothetical protein E2C01_077216 [Portunus trituberculatus]|uniref:Uncharacterized protein n=1 Tax=Portunus trituberculatus TaxID=210409 RepID=A0A5B7IQS4_PORTR|nr:hypothetical protein [Portunus trituberculatus]
MWRTQVQIPGSREAQGVSLYMLTLSILPAFPPNMRVVLATKNKPTDYKPKSRYREMVINAVTSDLNERGQM